MADLRQRNVLTNDTKTTDEAVSKKDECESSDGEMIDTNAAASLPQSSDKTTEMLDSALKDVTPRWRNWIIRGIFSWVMILSFAFIIWMGPLVVVLLVLFIQIKCFHEIITIGYVVYRSHELPWFRTLSWYFLIASNYFFYGESMMQYFGVLLSRAEFAKPLVTYHRFISFSLYVAGFVGFVFSLVKKHYLKQFTLFGWTHVTLVIIVTQSHLIIQNIFEGLIWFLVPVSMIICNDIMAYVFGFFFGKTPLIKLSPKKTWEGFIGGAFATVMFGLLISYALVQFDLFVCPIEYDEVKEALSNECERAYEFRLTDYNLPMVIQNLGRADFGDTIPGHGGFMDRFDCQLLMATFVHVYHSSFIKAVSPLKLVQQVLQLRPEEQLQVFTMLKDNLIKRGLLAIK